MTVTEDRLAAAETLAGLPKSPCPKVKYIVQPSPFSKCISALSPLVRNMPGTINSGTNSLHPSPAALYDVAMSSPDLFHTFPLPSPAPNTNTNIPSPLVGFDVSGSNDMFLHTHGLRKGHFVQKLFADEEETRSSERENRGPNLIEKGGRKDDFYYYDGSSKTEETDEEDEEEDEPSDDDDDGDYYEESKRNEPQRRVVTIKYGRIQSPQIIRARTFQPRAASPATDRDTEAAAATLAAASRSVYKEHESQVARALASAQSPKSVGKATSRRSSPKTWGGTKPGGKKAKKKTPVKAASTGKPSPASAKKPYTTSPLTKNKLDVAKKQPESKLKISKTYSTPSMKRNVKLESRSTPLNTPGDEPAKNPCNCKKSKCLKLYCECFGAKRYCVGCNCLDCSNIPSAEPARQNAIKATLERNPSAFKPKIGPSPANGVVAKGQHHKGCHCKKSGCLKKYCECFLLNVLCGANCKCAECKNYQGSEELKKRRQSLSSSSDSLRLTPSVPRFSPHISSAVKAESRMQSRFTSPVTKRAAVNSDRTNAGTSAKRKCIRGSPQSPSKGLVHEAKETKVNTAFLVS